MADGVRGLSLLNEEGGLIVFFPSNSFVTNTTLTHTNSPRGESQGAPRGNDHIVCYGMNQFTTRVIWRNSSGAELEDCGEPCRDCGGRCVRNGGVGVDMMHLVSVPLMSKCYSRSNFSHSKDGKKRGHCTLNLVTEKRCYHPLAISCNHDHVTCEVCKPFRSFRC